jgi:hypothetical protein
MIDALPAHPRAAPQEQQGIRCSCGHGVSVNYEMKVDLLF